MQVEALAVALRNRSNWEAIDLGFGLGRKWFFQLWCAWLLSALPVFVALAILTYIFIDAFFTPYLYVIFWWLKPLYEQPLLFIISRQTFSETVTFNYIKKNYFAIIKPQLFALLSWRRFGFSRSYYNPVAMLEGLSGKKRRKRLDVLNSQNNSSSVWLTILCVFIEFIFYFGIFLFVFLLFGEFIDANFIQLLESENTNVSILDNAAYFLSVSIIAPFYVASGFSLYISRRTKLEGWDIELAFKRLQNRISDKTSVSKLIAAISFLCISSVLLFSVLSFSIQVAHASEFNVSKNEAKETITFVMQGGDFGETKKIKKYVYISDKKEKSDSNWLENFQEWWENLIEALVDFLFGDLEDKEVDTGWFNFNIFEILIWSAVIGLLIWIINKYSHLLNWINPGSSKDKNTNAIPNKLFGMEISKDSLPDDVYSTASTLFHENRYREALSLLYRGSLAAIVHKGDVEILSSTTEQECSNIIRNRRPEDESQYFSTLTQTWIHLAYANEIPSENTLTKLFDNWRTYYAHGDAP